MVARVTGYTDVLPLVNARVDLRLTRLAPKAQALGYIV